MSEQRNSESVWLVSANSSTPCTTTRTSLNTSTVKRKGYHAYEIQRKELRSLTIVTTNDYEFTADRLYSLLESYEGIDPDLVGVTNPNCRGFSTDSLQAASRANIPLVRFDDFLDDLGSKWT
jgi:hypothetical protein